MTMKEIEKCEKCGSGGAVRIFATKELQKPVSGGTRTVTESGYLCPECVPPRQSNGWTVEVSGIYPEQKENEQQ